MIYTEIFDSLQSFCDTINSRKTNSLFLERNELSSQRKDDCFAKFSGTASYQEAEDLMLHGDRNMLDKLHNVNVKSISGNQNNVKLQIEKNVFGCVPNIPNFIIGVPNNMLNFKRIHMKTKIINIVVNIGVSYRISADEIIKASAKVASIVKEVEKNGLRVNLYVACVVTKPKDTSDFVCAVIKVKKSSSPLNMLNISYPLINPSMLRRHFFRFIETVPARLSKKYLKSYGWAGKFNNVLALDSKFKKHFDKVVSLDLIDVLDLSQEDVVEMIAVSTNKKVR